MHLALPVLLAAHAHVCSSGLEHAPCKPCPQPHVLDSIAAYAEQGAYPTADLCLQMKPRGDVWHSIL